MELQNFEHALAQAGKRHTKNLSQFAKLIETFEGSIAGGDFPTLAVQDKADGRFSVLFLGHEWCVRMTTDPQSGAGAITAYAVNRLPDVPPQYTPTDRVARIDQSGNISVGQQSGHTGDETDVRAVLFHVLGLHKAV